MPRGVGGFCGAAAKRPATTSARHEGHSRERSSQLQPQAEWKMWPQGSTMTVLSFSKSTRHMAQQPGAGAAEGRASESGPAAWAPLLVASSAVAAAAIEAVGAADAAGSWLVLLWSTAAAASSVVCPQQSQLSFCQPEAEPSAATSSACGAGCGAPGELTRPGTLRLPRLRSAVAALRGSPGSCRPLPPVPVLPPTMRRAK
jgi:hypothetical protein